MILDLTSCVTLDEAMLDVLDVIVDQNVYQYQDDVGVSVVELNGAEPVLFARLLSSVVVSPVSSVVVDHHVTGSVFLASVTLLSSVTFESVVGNDGITLVSLGDDLEYTDWSGVVSNVESMAVDVLSVYDEIGV